MALKLLTQYHLRSAYQCVNLIDVSFLAAVFLPNAICSKRNSKAAI